MSKPKTSEKILAIARDILADDGPEGLSFDAIARELGKSKQAVLYWYPTKRDLLAALYLPWLRAEVRVASSAIEAATSPAEAVAAFVRAVAAFHLDDLSRFRMMYLVPQVTRRATPARAPDPVVDDVHPVTDQLYGDLAAHLDAPDPRAEAMAIHSAVLGVVLMVSLGDALSDPLKHGADTLVEALASRLAA